MRWVGLLFLALGIAALAEAETRYVTDRTQVELRRGPSTEYRILRYLEAGDLVEVLERALGTKAQQRLLPAQPGDVAITSADGSDLARDTGFTPAIPIEDGIPRFVRWYREFYRV